MNAPATPFCPKCKGAVLAPGARSLGVPVCKCREPKPRYRASEEWDASDEWAEQRRRLEAAGMVVRRDVELRAVDQFHVAALKKGGQS